MLWPEAWDAVWAADVAANTLMSDATQAVERYADMVRRVCLLHCKQNADVEDVFQTVFLKYVQKAPFFQDDEHEKAWLLRVTINTCKDLHRSFFKKHIVSLTEVGELTAPFDDEESNVMEALLSLPPQYRDILYLHYYEGYPATEIARLLHKNVNTIYSTLARARASLKKAMGGMEDGI